MKTVGQILKSARLEKQISLEQASEFLKIRREFLEALENDNFSDLPSYISTAGFLKNYAEFLGLSPDAILAIFRRDFSLPKELTHRKRGSFSFNFNWTPKSILILTIIISLLGLGGYLGFQYFSFRKAPFLKLISPAEGEKIFQEKIEVKGKAQPDSLVTINDTPVFLSLNGDFHLEVELFPGENRIIVVAKNKFGKETKIERTVFHLDK
jgi:cytoskeletal protein RodZ